MKHLKKYNLFESKEYREEVDDIIDIMLDITDEFDTVEFKSLSGIMKLNDYYNKNDKYDNFKPVYKAGNKIRSRFSIQFYRISNYDKLNWLVTEMSSVIGRLSDLGWKLSNMNIVTSSGTLDLPEVSFTYLTYDFIKPDVIISDDLPKAEEIEKIFNDNTQLVTHKGDIYIDDNYVDIGFDAKTYDGGIPEDVDSEFKRVADILGFTEFERDINAWGVRFWFN
jgi:hypothetical protein